MIGPLDGQESLNNYCHRRLGMKISIKGIEFDVTERYAEGHVCSAIEAQVLNQTRAENIANNFRPTVAEAQADGDTSQLAGQFEAIDSAYEFGTRRARETDPVAKAAKALARTALESKLNEDGKTVKQYRDTVGKDAFNAKIAEIAAMPQIQKHAKTVASLSL